MVNVTLLVVSKPAENTATVLTSNLNKVPIVRGSGGGGNSYLCGGCGLTLAEHINAGQIVNILLLCPRCGAYNRMRT
jgi:hypothetical protein